MGTMALTEEFPGVPPLKPTSASSGTIESVTLPSGTKLASYNNSGGLSSLKIAIAAGSSKETFSSKGAAQLLGVSAFSGSENKTGLALIREFDELGAQVYTSADRELITLGVSMPSETTSEVMELMKDIISSPPPSFVYIDSKVTASLSYNSLKTNPISILNELIYEASYGESSPLANFYATSLDSVSHDEVLKYRLDQFKSGNFIITGNNISMESLKTFANDCNLPNGSTSTITSPFKGGEFKLKSSYGSDSAVAIAFPISSGDKSSDVIQNSILAKACGMPLIPFSGAGIMGFYSIGEPLAVTTALNTAVTELKAIANGSDVSNALAKVSVDSKLLLSNSPNDVLISTSMYGTSEPSAASVKAAASAALKGQPAYAVLGTIPGTPELKTILG